MDTQTATRQEVEVFTFPGFMHRGIYVEGGSMPRSGYSDLGSNESFAVKALRSSPATVMTGLYFVGEDKTDGMDLKHVPKGAQEGGLVIYRDCQDRARGKQGWQGRVYKDVIVLLPKNQTPKGHTQMGDRHRLARYFRNVENLQEDGTFTETEEPIFPAWVPVNGIAVPTPHGLVDLRTGICLETVESKADKLENEEEALARWEQASVPREQAKNRLSRFYIGGEFGVTYAVGSGADDYDGPLCFDLDDRPGGRYLGIGSLPLSRSPSGARPASEKEYEMLAGKLATTEENLRDAQERIQNAERALKGKQ